ncbi:MAG: ATP-binding cassette domain-containing protein [Dehalococcoidia bacterium]|nr:MAG: ATP-binding cassette domain-containing protein [Dehalococcoidia bacterium]
MENLVETRDLKTLFPILRGLFRQHVGDVRAVDGITLSIERRQWMGLVGESGCGKTTLGKTILRLLKPTSGHIYLDVNLEIKEKIDELEKTQPNSKAYKEIRSKYDLATFAGSKLKNLRKSMQLVYQDPFTSLDPRMKIKDTLLEPISVHGLMKGQAAKERVGEVMEMVGLSQKQLPRYPHQFSGGQRQRIAIARALVTNPQFVVFDEPTSALDVSVQAQILILLDKLKQEHNLTYLYITHDLSVAETVCDSIAVMYLGKIVEMGNPSDIFKKPRHPYSRALVLSTPIADPTRKRGRHVLPGEVPSPANPPPGCRFHPRCDRATDECKTDEPPLLSEGGLRSVACFHPIE